MYIESEYISEQFIANFIEKKTGPIILYGTGLNTQRLLEKVRDDKIVGLMDEKKTGQILWGYKVLSYEEVAAIEGVIIVIIARNAVINTIYRRIENFCGEYGIRVFDIHGKELGEKFEKKYSLCFQLKEEELLTAIIEHDVIFWELFDTLLMCTDLESKLLLKRREKMCEIYQWAIQKGKQIYIISNSHQSKGIIVEDLKTFDIHGYEDILIFDNDTNLEQLDLQKLYEKVDAKVNIETDKKYLYIGKIFENGNKVEANRILDYYRIYSAKEMFESSIYSKSLLHCKSLEEKLVIINFIERAYNNPFQKCEKNGKIVLDQVEDVIGLFIAPIIFKYVIWLMQKVNTEGCDFLIFPSRDGFLIKKIYGMIREVNKDLQMPEDTYLYTSRRAAMIAAVKDEEDIKEINSFIFVQGKEELLKERYGIEIKESQMISDSFLKQKCQEEQVVYKEYLKQIGLDKYKKIGFMDFVAMGTVQVALEKILGKKLIGIYFLRRLAEKQEMIQMNCHSLYQPAGDFQMTANIYRFYYLLETIITSYEPTFWGIDSHGKKIFYEEKRDKEVILLLKRIHDEILRYSKEMLKVLPDINNMCATVDLYDELLGYFSADYSVLETDEFNKLVNIDEFMGKTVADLNR